MWGRKRIGFDERGSKLVRGCDLFSFYLWVCGLFDLDFEFEREWRYLVDPASSYMLVSKIKPCKCKYKLLYGETAKGSIEQL